MKPGSKLIIFLIVISFICFLSACNQGEKCDETGVYISSILCFDDYVSKNHSDQHHRLFSRNIVFIDSVDNQTISKGNIGGINEDIHQVNYGGEINSEVKSLIDSLWGVKWVDYNLKSRNAYKKYVRENDLLYVLSPIFRGEKSNSYYVLLWSSTKHMKVFQINENMECEIIRYSDYR